MTEKQIESEEKNVNVYNNDVQFSVKVQQIQHDSNHYTVVLNMASTAVGDVIILTNIYLFLCTLRQKNNAETLHDIRKIITVTVIFTNLSTTTCKI